MLGKHHMLIAGTSLFAGLGIIQALEHHQIMPDWLASDLNSVIPHTPLGTAAVLGLSLLGSLLPDIDRETSILGKRAKRWGSGFVQRFGHRTWSHTIWMLIPLIILSYWLPPLIWVAFGYANHLWVDCYSTAGVALTWPFRGYVRYDNGAFYVNNPKRLKIWRVYRTGSFNETMLTLIIVSINLGIILFVH